MLESVCQKEAGDGNSGRTGTVDNDFTVFLLLAGYAKTIDDSGKNNDRSTVLVIMEYRNIKHLF